MSHRSENGSGVSEVVGEMIMIALVVILLSVFSASLYMILPADRDPSITIMMSSDRHNVTLWHKGGDFVRNESLSIIVANATHRQSFPAGSYVLVPDKPVFDLGSNITVQIPAGLEGNETVKLATSRAVIYSGRVSL